MKLNYFPETDTLYIDLADRPSIESEVVNENLIIDLDAQGYPVGITLEHYSQAVSSQSIEISLPMSLSIKTEPIRKLE